MSIGLHQIIFNTIQHEILITVWRTGTAEGIFCWAPIPCVPIGKAASWYMVEDRVGMFVFQCLPLWELKASVVPGSGHNSWIFLSPSLVRIKNAYYFYLPAKLFYSTLFRHTKLFSQKIWVTLACYVKDLRSEIYCTAIVKALVVRDSPIFPLPQSLGIPATLTLQEN